ncbi:hypothetical protein EJ08DRAFT_401743 [Tothia fuscella]|uniref:Calpain catalytic domain-containing protein n=1 Tax=Tothia fuscella TaxID=1048955 RepID=A0A9P4NKS6_9PEZI|nr:hypothetical protein EJ08DRAFT_401743 [Tothia fuscella]
MHHNMSALPTLISFFIFAKHIAGIATAESRTLLDPNAQPIAAVDARLQSYSWISQLGFSGGQTFGSLKREDKKLQRRDVQQGNLGYCGLLAGVLAMIASGRHAELGEAITLHKDNNFMAVKFKRPLRPTTDWWHLSYYRKQPTVSVDVVNIDDKLVSTLNNSDHVFPREVNFFAGSTPLDSPKPKFGDDSSGNLPAFLSSFWKYMPKPQRPAIPESSLSASPPLERTLYVPFLEKAWAKYLGKGYAGLDGISPTAVLEGLTGLPGQKVRRMFWGDRNVEPAVADCVRWYRPCVVGFYGNYWAFSPQGREAPHNRSIETSNLIIKCMHGSPTRPCGDFRVLEKVTGRTICLSSHHAYAIDVENSDRLNFYSRVPIGSEEVVIISPWSFPFALSALPGGWYAERTTTMRLTTLMDLTISVFFVGHPTVN